MIERKSQSTALSTKDLLARLKQKSQSSSHGKQPVKRIKKAKTRNNGVEINPVKPADTGELSGDDSAVSELFRRKFEENFTNAGEVLSGIGKSHETLAEESNSESDGDSSENNDLLDDSDDLLDHQDSSDDEFSGFSDSDEAFIGFKEPVEPVVVKFQEKDSKMDYSKKEKRHYLSSTAPKAVTEKPQRKKDDKDGDNVESDTELDLKNDRELQRLLAESHILSSQQESSTVAMGKHRLKTLEHRLSSLGVDLSQQNMPMHVRKGMLKKRIQAGEKYEKHAKDAGIILAKKARGDVREVPWLSGIREDGSKGVSATELMRGKLREKAKKEGMKYKGRELGLQIVARGVGKSVKGGIQINKAEIEEMKIDKGKGAKGKSGSKGGKRGRKAR